MNPTPGDVHVNVPLTNVSIAYAQDANNFVASKVFPLVPVEKQSDKYWSIPKGAFRRIQMKRRGAGVASPRVDWEADSSNTYFADVWSLAKDIADQVRANSDAGLDQDRIAVKLLTQQALLRREKTFAANYLATGWGTDMTGVAGAPAGGQVRQWNEASATPLADVAAGKLAVLLATGMEPMDLVITYPVWNVLKNHPEIVDRVKYGQTAGGPARVSVEAVAALMELERIHVMKASEETSAESAASVTNAFIGGKTALLAYSTRTPAMEEPSAGYTYAWRGYLGAGPDGQRIKRYRRPEEYAADSVEIEIADDMKRVATDCGYFFNTVVA